MTPWTRDDLQKLDVKYANEGVHLHQRPFRAAMELLGNTFALGMGGNPEVKKIIDAYVAMFPETNASWPGAGIGLAASIDRVRKVTLPVVFGTGTIEVWQATGFASAEEWWDRCREDHDIGSQSSFAFADLHDLAYGLNEAEKGNAEALTLWRMARSNLEDAANTLPATFSVDSVIQPICMVAELSLKGALVWDGVDPKSFKGKDGHNLKLLAERLATARPHRDDPLVAQVVRKLPSYVDSRYKPAGLTRLAVVRLAVAVQFIAASALRRITNTDFAAKMETGGWPSPRRPFFPVAEKTQGA
jgi:hypothetical protein